MDSSTPQQTALPSLPQNNGLAPVSPPPVDSPPEAPVPTSTAAADVQSQVSERLKSTNNVLVTVSSNPSVDQLASALGLTLLLDKLGKHATTVFSGEIPRAIEFLDPEATFEENVDSLRDFIIALDKEKADKLRYKVEEDVVRIFITPYKTTITEDDLQFSQGDFNVDVIIALGVVQRDDLDKAITAHGRILHDATVITVNAGEQTSSLGAIDWHNPQASSLAEMLVSVGETLGSDLLDEQISTAYLTGVVAATNRFSNEKTTPKVMNIAAQLMAAGANQQLIASNLRQDGMLSESIQKPSDDHAESSEVTVEHKKETKKASSTSTKKPSTQTSKKVLADKETTEKEAEESTSDSPEPKDETPPPPVDFPPKTDDNTQSSDQDEPLPELPDELKAQIEPPAAKQPSEKSDQPTSTEETTPSLSDIKADTGTSSEPMVTPEAETPATSEPAFNATMAQAEADRKEEVSPLTPPLPDNSAANVPPLAPSVTPPSLNTPADDASTDAATSDDQPATTAADDQAAALEEARKAVESAAESQPFSPANNPIASLNAQPLPSLDTSADPAPVTLSPPADSDDLAPSIESSTSGLPSVPNPDDSFMSGGLGAPEPTPMDSFMSAHQKSTIQPETSASPVSDPPSFGAPTPPATDGLPPMPPLPQALPTDGSLPPLPPLPGQVSDPAAGFQPTTQPDFMAGQTPSQNPWTQAGDDLTAKKDDEEANRQAKMDEMNQQYDSAVDRNREINGLPPLNNPNGSGLPPVPPTQ